MNMFDEALAIRGMLSARDITQSTLAKILGVSQPYIANKLRLLNFSDRIRKKIIEKGISERHARTLLRLGEDEQNIAIDRIHEGSLNAQRTEIMVDRMIEEALAKDGCELSGVEAIHRFEKILDTSLANLRRTGCRVRAKKEKLGEKTYIGIFIE